MPLPPTARDTPPQPLPADSPHKALAPQCSPSTLPLPAGLPPKALAPHGPPSTSTVARGHSGLPSGHVSRAGAEHKPDWERGVDQRTRCINYHAHPSRFISMPAVKGRVGLGHLAAQCQPAAIPKRAQEDGEVLFRLDSTVQFHLAASTSRTHNVHPRNVHGSLCFPLHPTTQMANIPGWGSSRFLMEIIPRRAISIKHRGMSITQ